MSERLKVLTIVGTRPEIIRLAPTIKMLDRYAKHVLVHTGQNYDYELNEVFFEDLGLRRPDYFLEADVRSLGATLGSILERIEKVLLCEKPDATLILGDTNSSIAALMSKRLKIPVYHMEAGNRSFDENVPEETNRRLVDHISDYNLVYSEHARRNLIAEGIHPSRILHTGSPMLEVISENLEQIRNSRILETEGLRAGEYFLVSVHREENVDNPARLKQILESLKQLRKKYDIPVLVSTHPRTKARLQGLGETYNESLVFHAPFGFNDYIALQTNARFVLSDSGTISEESSMLGSPSASLRDAVERPEAIDTGSCITVGTNAQLILDAVSMVIDQTSNGKNYEIPYDYQVPDTARRVVNFIFSTALTHKERNNIRIHG